MTIKELLEKLQGLDPALLVKAWTSDPSGDNLEPVDMDFTGEALIDTPSGDFVAFLAPEGKCFTLNDRTDV